MFVDTHTHFYDDWLLPDAEAAILRALEAGVGKMVQADVDSRERPAMWEIGNRHPGVIYQMLGLYPGSVTADNWREELDEVYHIADKVFSPVPALDQVHHVFGPSPIPDTGPSPANVPQNSMEATISGLSPRDKMGPSPNECQTSANNTVDLVQGSFSEKPGDVQRAVVAIGEIGLDYHEGLEFVKEQKEVLRLQLELAARMDLPVNIHLRDAWEDFFGVLADCRHLHLRGNLHCFTASYEIYERANRYGDFSVGIGGVVTFKNASLAKTLERIPMEKILLETDAPYLAPVPHRGQRNESAYLPLIAAKVADIKGLSLDETETITTNNAETLFQI